MKHASLAFISFIFLLLAFFVYFQLNSFYNISKKSSIINNELLYEKYEYCKVDTLNEILPAKIEKQIISAWKIDSSVVIRILKESTLSEINFKKCAKINKKTTSANVIEFWQIKDINKSIQEERVIQNSEIEIVQLRLNGEFLIKYSKKNNSYIQYLLGSISANFLFILIYLITLLFHQKFPKIDYEITKPFTHQDFLFIKKIKAKNQNNLLLSIFLSFLFISLILFAPYSFLENINISKWGSNSKVINGSLFSTFGNIVLFIFPIHAALMYILNEMLINKPYTKDIESGIKYLTEVQIKKIEFHKKTGIWIINTNSKFASFTTFSLEESEFKKWKSEIKLGANLCIEQTLYSNLILQIHE